MRILLCSLALVALTSATAQRTYHVHPRGSDAAAGTSAAAAFRTIGRGIEALRPGDTLLIGDGLYREGGKLLVDSLVATPEQPTVIKSVRPWGARIEGVVYHAFLVEVQHCRHLVIDGLEVYHPGEGPDEDWSTGISVQTSDYVTVRNCYVHDCGCGGFGGRTGDYLTFEDNVAVGNARDSPYNCSGISIYHPKQLDDAPGPHIVVRRNVTFGNACRQPFSVAGFTTPTDGNGIILDDYANDQADIDPTGSANPAYTAVTLIEGNLSFGNGGAGIKTYKVPNAVVRHNTAYHNNYVLADYGAGSVAEIGFEYVDGHVEATDNIGVAAHGRASNAFYYAPWPGLEGQARLSAKRNVLVGQVAVTGDTLSRRTNTLQPAFRQSYAGFAEAVDTVRDFASIEELRARFRLREGSPAVGKGAFAKTVQASTPLPPDPVPVAVLNRTPVPIAIDGRREGWYSAPGNALVSDADAGVAPGAWWGAYDSTHLYVYVEHGGTPRAAVLMFAGDPTRGTVREARHALADGRSAQEFSVPWRELGLAPGQADTLALNVFVALPEDPRAVQAFRPMPSWIGDTARVGRLATTMSKAEFRRRYALGRAVLVDKATPPVLPQGAPTHTYPVAQQLGGTLRDGTDLAATWSAYHDAMGLHVHVAVTDDTLTADSGEAWYDDDGIEVYLDADNSKTFNDYDPNDYHVTVGLDGRVVDRRGHLGPGATAAVERVAGGYTVALTLPWSATGIAPAPGTFIGFDVHVVDDDGDGDGGPRDAKLAWFAERDQSYKNAALFGTVVIGK